MTIIELGNTVIECLSTDEKPSKPDGWFLKEIDSGNSFIRRDGVWTDLNLGLSFIKATKSGSITTDASGNYNVVFETPFVDTGYTVALSCQDGGGNDSPIAFFSALSKSGFKITTKDSKSGISKGSVTVSWLSTKNYNP